MKAKNKITLETIEKLAIRTYEEQAAYRKRWWSGVTEKIMAKFGWHRRYKVFVIDSRSLRPTLKPIIEEIEELDIRIRQYALPKPAFKMPTGSTY